MKKKTLNLLILNLIITCGIWAAYFYIMQNVTKTNDSFDDVKHKILFAMKKSQAIDTLRNKIKVNYDKGFDLNTFIINPDQTAEVVQNIEGFGPLTGTKVVTQSVANQEAVGLPNGVDFLKITMGIEGPKQNVLTAIRLIENLPYNTKINKLTFSKLGEASSTARWSANIDLVLVKLSENNPTK